MKNSKLTILIASLTIIGLIVPVLGEEERDTAEDLAADMAVDWVTPSEDGLLARYEKDDRIFTRLEIDKIKMVSFFHRRKIGEVIVEKDFIRYQFDTESEELIEEKKQWRTGLPKQVTPVITKEQAESMVEGSVTTSKLFFISPESDVFPIKPTPENPCWILWSRDGEKQIITIFDAMTGEKLGYGVPPPYEGFSCYGPDWGDCPQDPIEYWNNHAESARSWFETMGYSTEKVGNASEAKIQGHIQSDSTAMFYELNHGGSWSFHNYCDSSITASEVDTWMASYANMPFTFLGSCDGMCDQTDNHLSYEFRKGSNIDTVTVGYCGMSSPSCESDCWPDAVSWQNELFDWMSGGHTVEYAFYRANLAFPDCSGANNCMRFAGDITLTMVPEVTRSLCGTLVGPAPVFITFLSGGGSRDHYIRCNITAGGNGIIINNGATLVFLNNSKIIGSALVNATGAGGGIRFVSEEDRTQGMKFTGEVKIYAGGQIKIYE